MNLVVSSDGLNFFSLVHILVVCSQGGWAEFVVYHSSVHLVLLSLRALWECSGHGGSTNLVHTTAHLLRPVALCSGTVAVSLC